MQAPPSHWTTRAAPRGPNKTIALIASAIAVVGLAVVLFAGGRVLLLLRTGSQDLVDCSDLTNDGKYAAAIPKCRSLVRKLPRLADGHNNLAWCLAMVGSPAESETEARTAVQLDPSRFTYDTLAMALAVSGKGNEALKTENDHVLVRGNVGDDSRHVTLGMAYYATGKKHEARTQWEIARNGSTAEARRLATEFEAKYP